MSDQPQFYNPIPQGPGPGGSHIPATPPPDQPRPARGAREKKKWWPLVAAGGAGLVLGSLLFSSTETRTVTVSEPGPTVTVGTQAPAPDPAPDTEEPAPVEPPPATVGAKSFKVGVKVLKKQCFGEAGCNVTYKIKPEWDGPGEYPGGVAVVTYKVSGLEDEAISTFTVDDSGTAQFEEEYGSTRTSTVKLKAKVTEVEYTP